LTPKAVPWPPTGVFCGQLPLQWLRPVTINCDKRRRKDKYRPGRGYTPSPYSARHSSRTLNSLVTTRCDKEDDKLTTTMQPGRSAAGKDPMMTRTFVIARFRDNHQTRTVTNGQRDLRDAAAEPLSCINMASSRWGRPATAVSHSIPFVTPMILTHRWPSFPRGAHPHTPGDPRGS
jgi:hypothetical protein